MASSSPAPGWDVFLSYSSADSRRVRRLASALRDRGARVWLDETEIPVGGSIPLAVEDGVERSRVMVLCLSPAFLASEWTRAERSAAQFADPANRDRTLIPILFKPCQLPKTLAHLKYLDYRRHSDKVVDELVAALGDLGSAAKAPAHPVEAMLNKAGDLDRSGDDVQALALTRQALEAAETAGTGDGVTGLLLSRARRACARRLLVVDGDRDEAWRLATLAAAEPELATHPEMQFGALITKAEVAIATGRLQLAEGAIGAAVELATDAEDRLTCLEVSAQFEARRGRVPEAIALYDEAASAFLSMLSNESDPDEQQVDKAGVAGCMNNKALLLRDLGDIGGAIKHLSQAAQWYADALRPVDESVSRLLLARAYFHEQEWHRAWESLDRALELARASSFDRGVIECLELRGRALATAGEPANARAALEEGLEVATVVGDLRAVMKFHWKLSTLAQDAPGDLSLARDHLERARASAEAIGDGQSAAEILLELDGLGTDGSVDPQRRTAVIEALKSQLTETEIPGHAAYLMARIATEQGRAGELDRAMVWFGRARDAFAALSDADGVGRVLLSIADVEMAQNQHAAPERHANEALAVVAGHGNWEVEVGARFCLARLALARRDPRAAKLALDDAREIAATRHMREASAEMGELSDEVDRFLSLHAAPTLTLAELGAELHELITWFPEAEDSLLRFWFYWRSMTLLANIRADAGVKGLIVSHDATAIAGIRDDFGVLLDTTLFASDEEFANAPPGIDIVPFPMDKIIPECVGVMLAVSGSDVLRSTNPSATESDA